MPTPTPELRAKTVLATTSSVEVGVLDHRALLRRHALDARGAVLFALDEVAPRCADRVAPGETGPVLDVVAVDVSTVPSPDRLRGVVRMSGPVEVLGGGVRQDVRDHLDVGPSGLVGRLVPDRVTLEWHVEAQGPVVPVTVDPRLYAFSPVDPLGGWEAGWVEHLAVDHEDVLRRLAGRTRLLGTDAVVRPVLADSLGLVLRVVEDGRRRDVRIPFPRPVTCGCEAIRSLEQLVTARS